MKALFVDTIRILAILALLALAILFVMGLGDAPGGESGPAAVPAPGGNPVSLDSNGWEDGWEWDEGANHELLPAPAFEIMDSPDIAHM